MTTETLVAQPRQTTVENLFTDIRSTADSIERGDWLGAGTGVVNVAMDVIGMGGDPLGAIGSSGVSWVLGAVSFLREPFDVLKGDPGAITSSAQSWGSSATSLASTARDYQDATVTQTQGWGGAAADGYRAASSSQANGLSALSQAGRGVAQAISGAGQALASARKVVMDLIGEAVQKIIQICIEALSKSWLSFGASIAQGIAQSVQKAVQTGQKLLTEIQQLVSKLQQIIQTVQKIVQTAKAVKDLLEQIGGRASGDQRTAPAQTVQVDQAPPPVRLGEAATEPHQHHGPVSQNGWPADPPRGPRTIPGTNVRVNVANGPAGDVLIHVLAQVHSRVERIDLNSERGEADDWGYANRPVRGGAELSNHASATAVDMNATRHVLGERGTFSQTQVDEIHRILGEVDNVVRWGGDYRGRADEMHFEINGTVAEVTAVANRLRAAQQ
jgi:uncharacterized protein YukE